MHRRTYLALAASSLAGAGGCLDAGPTADADPTGSPSQEPGDRGGSRTTPTGTPRPDATTLELGEPFEPSAGWSVTLSNARVRPIALRAGVHLDPVGVPGAQFVIADVAVDGDPNGTETAGVLPDPADFAVTLDGAVTVERRGFWAGQTGRPAERDGTFAAPVLSADADRAAIRWRAPDPPVEWRLTAAHREAIANAPEFEVREFSVPASVERGAGFEASLTVANTGARDGRFLAELGATTISDTPELSFDVPVGAAVDHAEPLSPHYPTEAGELRIVLNWGLGRLERQVAVA